MILVVVFLCSLVQNYMVCREFYHTAQLNANRAALWCVGRSTMSFLLTLFIVVETQKMILAIPYVLGDVIGTYLASGGLTRIRKLFLQLVVIPLDKFLGL